MSKRPPSPALTLVAAGPTRARRQTTVKFVRVEELLFAELQQSNRATPYSDGEIERLARLFGLSVEEVDALYRPSRRLKRAATAARSPARR
ncbi:MAG: hypothetical protein JOY81_13540 [Alphaproteobacteria bacterium]|nr:hypothetical protein [Alphaproteobacteria bacterium]